mgnify:CR=1 FL=1
MRPLFVSRVIEFPLNAGLDEVLIVPAVPANETASSSYPETLLCLLDTGDYYARILYSPTVVLLSVGSHIYFILHTLSYGHLFEVSDELTQGASMRRDRIE